MTVSAPRNELSALVSQYLYDTDLSPFLKRVGFDFVFEFRNVALEEKFYCV